MEQAEFKLDLPSLPHKLLNEPLMMLVEFYKEQGAGAYDWMFSSY